MTKLHHNLPNHLLDDIEYHSPFDDNTVYNASSTAHGYMPKLSATSTTFLDGAGAFTDPIYSERAAVIGYNYKAFTAAGTSADVNLVSLTATYGNASAAATTMMYPIMELVIPPWVERSTVALVMVVAACSSNTDYGANINCGIYIKSGRGGMTAGLEMPASTLYQRIPGMISYYAVDSGTSGVDTFTTELSIVGGETFTFYALSTAANQIKISSLKLQGTETTQVAPSGTSLGTINLTTNIGG